MPVTIVVPEGNSTEKNAAMVALGAELVVHGEDYQAALEHARMLAETKWSCVGSKVSVSGTVVSELFAS